jgi:hypothetical protein
MHLSLVPCPRDFRPFSCAASQELSVDELRLEDEVLANPDDQKLVEVSGTFHLDSVTELLRRYRLHLDPIIADAAVRTSRPRAMAHYVILDLGI